MAILGRNVVIFDKVWPDLGNFGTMTNYGRKGQSLGEHRQKMTNFGLLWSTSSNFSRIWQNPVDSDQARAEFGPSKARPPTLFLPPHGATSIAPLGNTATAAVDAEHEVASNGNTAGQEALCQDTTAPLSTRRRAPPLPTLGTAADTARPPPPML